ncbi:MAG: DinB family protein [Bacteroidetes bacterium]|nr:MAG: DinB family protein [Bacteroidota bacterium]
MDFKQGSTQMIHQITGLLGNISPEQYSKKLDIFKGSTLGQHFRHILDFYLVLLKYHSSGLVDYTLRERDLELETNPQYAMKTFEKVLSEVELLDEQTLLKVKADLLYVAEGERPLIPTSIGRELMYAYEHAVHHLAIIRIGIENAFPDLEIAKEVGIAPATIKYRTNLEN